MALRVKTKYDTLQALATQYFKQFLQQKSYFVNRYIWNRYIFS